MFSHNSSFRLRITGTGVVPAGSFYWQKQSPDTHFDPPRDALSSEAMILCGNLLGGFLRLDPDSLPAISNPPFAPSTKSPRSVLYTALVDQDGLTLPVAMTSVLLR